MKRKSRTASTTQGASASAIRPSQGLSIKATSIFILDQGAHRKLLNARHPDPEVDLRTRAIYLLQRITAMRISETLSLNVCQVWDGHEILPYVALEKDQTKGKRNGRNLSLLDQHRQAQRALREWIRFREKSEGPLDPNGPLFVSQTGHRLDRTLAHKSLQRWAISAGLPIGKNNGVTTHTARHTKLSEAVCKGDLDLAVAIAGHGDVRTLTETYLHVPLANMHDHNQSVKL